MSSSLAASLFGSGASASTANDIIGELDAAGVDSAVVVSSAYSSALDSDAAISAENNFAADEVAKFPNRLMGLCAVNAGRLSAPGEAERCLRNSGMVGVKVHLPGSDIDVGNDRTLDRMDALFAKLEELDAPVMIHTGTRDGQSLDSDRLGRLVRTLAEYPNLRVLLPHCTDVVNDQLIEVWLRFFEGANPLLDKDNYFVDTSACMNFYADAPLSQKGLIVWRLRQWGLDNVFFGSDYLRPSPEETPGDALDTLTRYPFDQEELDTILENDASDWLGG